MGGGGNLQKSSETGMHWMDLAKRRLKHRKKDRGIGGMLIYVWRRGVIIKLQKIRASSGKGK